MAVVVLPAPDGPTRATSSPGRTLKLTSRRTGSPGLAPTAAAPPVRLAMVDSSAVG
jgi:hypothetical protein